MVVVMVVMKDLWYESNYSGDSNSINGSGVVGDGGGDCGCGVGMI